MPGIVFRGGIVLALALVVATPARADLPLDKYMAAAKASATDKEAQAFLTGYFIGLAAGLEQLDVARQNPKTVDFCLPPQMPVAADQIGTLVDREVARGTFAAPPVTGGTWDVSIAARAALARTFPCPAAR